METNTTAYWAAKISEYEQKNPKARGVPKDLKESYKQAFDLEPEGTRTPITWKGRQAHLESHGTRTTKPGADKWKLVYEDTKDTKSNNRRASTKGKTISVEEREAWYKRNLYDNPRQRAEDNVKADAKARSKTKAKARKLTKAGIPSIYEHLSPLNAPEERAGGFESARNTVVAPAHENNIKSDKVASTKVLREQQVPVTRSGAIRADAHNIPIKGTDESRFNAVFDDIVSNNRPNARSLKKGLGLPFVGGFIAGATVLSQTGDAKAAVGAAVDAENPINNLDAGELFDESQDYQTVLDQAKESRKKPIKDALKSFTSNEAKYIGKSLMSGQLPYKGSQFFHMLGIL